MSRIIALGHYIPEKVVSNDDLIHQYQLDSSDEWIQQRTGITHRHFAREDESVTDLGYQAVNNLLTKYPQDQRDEILSQVNLIVVASMSSRGVAPSLASQIQAELNIEHAVTFDINVACSGFVYALDIANSISRSYQSGYTLVIASEKMSQILNFEDRGTAILFGDGAGACLIHNDGQGLIGYQSQLHGLADPGQSLAVNYDQDQSLYLSMNGREVFNFVQRTVLPSLEDFIIHTHSEDSSAESSLQDALDEIDYILLHQANDRFAQMIGRSMKLPMDKLPRNIAQLGNLSAASIPVLMSQSQDKGLLTLNGDQTIVMSGFGAGLAWGEIKLNI